jgi:hypothetical protein
MFRGEGDQARANFIEYLRTVPETAHFRRANRSVRIRPASCRPVTPPRTPAPHPRSFTCGVLTDITESLFSALKHAVAGRGNKQHVQLYEALVRIIETFSKWSRRPYVQPVTPGLKATLRVAGLKSLNLKRLFTCLQQTVTHTALLTMLDNYETNLLEYNVAPTDSLGPSDLGGAERDAMRTPGMCTVVEHRRYRDRHFVTQGAKACICAHTLCSCVLTRSIMPYARPLYVPVQFCMSGAPVCPRCPYMPPGAPACLFTPGIPVYPGAHVCPRCCMPVYRRYPYTPVPLYAPGVPACLFTLGTPVCMPRCPCMPRCCMPVYRRYPYLPRCPCMPLVSLHACLPPVPLCACPGVPVCPRYPCMLQPCPALVHVRHAQRQGLAATCNTDVVGTRSTAVCCVYMR